MEKTWKPMTAGILNIVAGAGVIIVSFFLIIGILLFSISSTSMNGMNIPMNMPSIGLLGIAILAIPFSALGILSIIGGVFALKRRIWGLALAGSIGAIFCSSLLGIASIVLTVLSKKEFG